jgi:hypothetical protein
VSDAIDLHIQAERCFRLAKGIAGPKLAEELEVLERASDKRRGSWMPLP